MNSRGRERKEKSHQGGGYLRKKNAETTGKRGGRREMKRNGVNLGDGDQEFWKEERPSISLTA